VKAKMVITSLSIVVLSTIPLSICTGQITELTITVVYDNNPYDNRLKTAWGISCLVDFNGRCILFDTGGDSPTLLSNMEKLQIQPDQIDTIVLSHIHGDHVGGLEGLLERNCDVTVYLPKSFPKDFKDKVKAAGAELCEVHEAMEVDGDSSVYTTGELDGGVKEQSLVIRTEAGLVVITGCAHPGVVNIVEKAKGIFSGKEEVLFVMGGFHLGGVSEPRIKEIITSFKEMGVRYVGPCHCSGDTARGLFKEAYGESFLEVGVGRIITLAQMVSAVAHADELTTTWGGIKK
jgi:7,8-dihydropterin-6-yl-methyl-4-(beta-D-ribofuranosyl)aminobenzene 5'-phosphate synthase